MENENQETTPSIKIEGSGAAAAAGGVAAGAGGLAAGRDINIYQHLEASKLDIKPEWLKNHLKDIERIFVNHIRSGEELTAEKATLRYVELLVRKRMKQNEPELLAPLSYFVEQPSARLLVFGEGGGGKTTSLLKLAVEIASQTMENPTAPIPLYVKLNFFDAKERGFDELLQIVSDSAGLDKDEMKILWRKGRRPFLFLLDGFNEVGQDFQRECALALQEFMQVGIHRYIITSRPGGQAEQLAVQVEGINTLDIVQLDKNQIQDFLARHDASGIYDRMGNQLKGLARNPFMLWGLAKSCSGLTEGELPRNIGQLYQNLVDRYIFSEREQKKVPPPTTYNYPLVKKPILARLALLMTQEGVTRHKEDRNLQIAVSEQLKEIRTENEGLIEIKPYELMPDLPTAKGLLDEAVYNGVLRRVGDTLEFMHQSVQDYFTAVALLSWPTEMIIRLTPPFLWRHIEIERSNVDIRGPFVEATIMLSGLLQDGNELLQFLKNHHPLLTAHCLAGAGNVQQSIQKDIQKMWLTLLGRRHERYRWIACKCLEIVKLDQPDIINRLAEVALKDENRSVQFAAALALGKIESEAAINSLIEMSINKSFESYFDDYYPSVWRQLDSHIAVRLLFDVWRNKEKDEGSGNRAAELLASMKREYVKKEFEKILLDAREKKKNNVKEAAEIALQQLDSWKGNSIITASKARALLERYSKERETIAHNLASKTVSQLIESLKDSNSITRDVAAKMLGERGAKEAFSALLDTLSYETDVGVRQEIVTALGKLSDKEQILSILNQKLHEVESTFIFSIESKFQNDLDDGKVSIEFRKKFEDHRIALPKEIRVSSLQGVNKLENEWILTENYGYVEKNLGHIYHVLKCKNILNIYDYAMRARFVALGEIIGKEALPTFTEALRDQNPQVRFALASALGEIGGKEAAVLLAELLRKEENSDVVEATIEALGKTKSDIAIVPLIEALRQLKSSELGEGDIGWGVTRSDGWGEHIHKALEKLDNKSQIIHLLQKALQDDDSTVRLTVTRELNRWRDADPQIINMLQEALLDKDSKVRIAAVKGLSKQQDEVVENLFIEVTLSDSEKTVRETAAKELRWFPGYTAIIRLIHTLEGADTNKRTVAAEALGLIEDDAAVSPLLAALKDNESSVCIAAAWALLKIKNEAAVDPSIQTLVEFASKDSNVNIREEAAKKMKDIPGGIDALYAPIKNAILTDNYAEVIKLIGEGPPFLPEDANLYWWRGHAYLGLKQFENALADYDQVTKFLPDFVDVYLNRADILSQLGQHEGAFAAARQAAKLAPDKADIQLILGWYAYKAGKYEEGIAASQRALELNPQLPIAAFNLGLALLTSGQVSKAKDTYQQAVRICEGLDIKTASANLKGALDDLDELVQSRSDLASAVGEFKQSLETAQKCIKDRVTDGFDNSSS